MLAHLDSTKDVDGATRNSPAAKQNETGRWRSKKKEEREQPRINVAATGKITHHPIESRRLIEFSTKSHRSRPFRQAFKRIRAKESKQEDVGMPNLTGDLKMVGQCRPPRHLNKIIKDVFPFSELGRLLIQACQLAIETIPNPENQCEQRSIPEISESIKQRHACPQQRSGKSELIWRDGCPAQAQNEPILNWCVYDRGEIQYMFLRRIPQQPFGQSAVLRQRSGKENRPNISAHTSDVARLLRSINGRYPAAHRLRGNFLPERNGAIFPDQPLAREQKSARKPTETVNVRIFPKGLCKRRRIGINKSGLAFCFGQHAQQALIVIKAGGNNQNTSVRRQCRGANAIQNITNSDLLGFALMKLQSDLSAVPRRLTGMPRNDFDRVRQNHRFAKAQLSGDATPS